jgi:hypothetical protein
MTLRLAHIVAACAEAWEVQPREIRNSRRSPALIEARWAVALLAREMTDASFTRIGLALGDKDHSSAFHGASRMEQRLAESESAAIRFAAARTALIVIQKAGLAHLLDAIDAVAVARRIEARPERFAAMATTNEITAMAQWIVEMAGPSDAPAPEFPSAATRTTETSHAA